ncbi:MAG: hypothetical protein AAGI03_06215 [Pseudomonadota bacterium]
MTQETDDDVCNRLDAAAGLDPALAEMMDGDAFAAALGAMRGAIAELEADGHGVVSLADAAVIAASQKVREHVKPNAWLAWCEHQRDMLDLIIQDADAIGTQLADATHKRRIN